MVWADASPESLLRPPAHSGAYRWYYADVVAGELTAVFIFMIGSIFSPRYSAALRRGGLPLEHCAVNFALYQKGARWLWVLSEYGSAVAEGPRALRIGASRLGYEDDGTLSMTVVDRTAPWGRAVEAHLTLTPQVPSHPEVSLVEGQPHFWQPVCARAAARLRVPAHGLDLQGRGYHDANHGAEPLGGGLPRWEWARIHRPDHTDILYRPPGVDPLWVHARPEGVQLFRAPAPSVARERTAWGLKVPARLDPKAPNQPRRLLESSPFYARLESDGPAGHALAEVADFQRFHLPYVRWMAHFRTRAGAAIR